MLSPVTWAFHQGGEDICVPIMKWGREQMASRVVGITRLKTQRGHWQCRAQVGQRKCKLLLSRLGQQMLWPWGRGKGRERAEDAQRSPAQRMVGGWTNPRPREDRGDLFVLSRAPWGRRKRLLPGGAWGGTGLEAEPGTGVGCAGLGRSGSQWSGWNKRWS